MTDNENQAPGELLLAGYLPVFGEGFALPCYAAHPLANIWYVAVCSVDGDHTGTVTGFEIFDADGVHRLPEKLQLKITLGAPWLRIPIQSGHLFRHEAGHRSNLIPATLPI